MASKKSLEGKNIPQERCLILFLTMSGSHLGIYKEGGVG